MYSSIITTAPSQCSAPVQAQTFVTHGVRRFQFDPGRAALAARDYQLELVNDLHLAVIDACAGERLQISLATGGGKTRIMNDLVYGRLLPAGANVLVLAPGWELVAQSVDDACARFPAARIMTTYVGGSGAEVEMFGAPQAAHARVTFTTTQTFHTRRLSDFAALSYDVVLLDEVHYGEHGAVQRAIYEKYKSASTFVGVTATRRYDSNYRLVGRSYDLAALVGCGVLATPELRTVETNIDWNPKLDATQSDYSARSLDELARNAARNRIIVDAFLKEQHRMGATIVFACNIAHAEVLCSMFNAAGVRAGVSHSKLERGTAKYVLAQFRDRRLDVIVNVRSLTMGVDIPHTTGILLASPTKSDILLHQMIGRGTRKTPTKDRFWVLDVVDNISGPNALFVKRPDGFFGSNPRCSSKRPLHTWAPSELTRSHSTLSAVDGLEIQPEQTFSVEFGFVPTAAALGDGVPFVQALGRIVPASSPGSAVDAPEPDRPLTWSYCSEGGVLRVQSPILLGVSGLEELAATTDTIVAMATAHGYRLSSTEPVHVLLGWCPDAAHLVDLVQSVGYFEPALASLAPPPDTPRLQRRPARRVVAEVLPLRTDAAWWQYMEQSGKPLHSIDLTPLFERGFAVDWPLHTDELTGAWLASWISLGMHVLDSAGKGKSPKGDPTKRVQSAPISRGPRGDINELGNFLGVTSTLMSTLEGRRAEVSARAWLNHPRFGRLGRRMAEVWKLVA
jgi:superfamily II DNA or RNA helicase